MQVTYKKKSIHTTNSNLLACRYCQIMTKNFTEIFKLATTTRTTTTTTTDPGPASGSSVIVERTVIFGCPQLLLGLQCFSGCQSSRVVRSQHTYTKYDKLANTLHGVNCNDNSPTLVEGQLFPYSKPIFRHLETRLHQIKS